MGKWFVNDRVMPKEGYWAGHEGTVTAVYADRIRVRMDYPEGERGLNLPLGEDDVEPAISQSAEQRMRGAR